MKPENRDMEPNANQANQRAIQSNNETVVADGTQHSNASPDGASEAERRELYFLEAVQILQNVIQSADNPRAMRMAVDRVEQPEYQDYITEEYQNKFPILTLANRRLVRQQADQLEKEQLANRYKELSKNPNS